MKINLSNTPAYCLNNSKYVERRNNIKRMCEFLGITVQFILSDTDKFSRQQNIAYDTVQLIYTAMCRGIYPFILLEDDASLIDSIPSFNINIPDEADLIYWGANKCSLHPNIILSEYNDEYYRICHTQSGHALLITNYKSAMFFKDILLQSLIYNEFSDVILPAISKSKLFLTPKDGPYFYQNDGRNMNITKFKWKNSNIPIV